MTTYENNCVGCETCTLGSGCPMLRQEVVTCDLCGDDAVYQIDGTDCCEECAAKYLAEIFKENYTVKEMASMVNAKLQEL